MKSGLNLLISMLRQFIVLPSTLLLTFFILAPLTFLYVYSSVVCIVHACVCGAFACACVYEDQRSTSGIIPLHMIHLGVLFYLIQGFSQA